MNRQAFTYILANKKHGTLYVGVTSDLERRLAEHRMKIFPGFTSKYDVTKLVWFEEATDIRTAIENEKRIKNRGRAFKISLIESANPNWNDLAVEFVDSALPDACASSPQNDGMVTNYE